MTKKFLLLSLAGALVLTACDDPKAANKENFSKALQEWLTAKPQSAVCLSVPVSSYLPDNSPLKSATITIEQAKHNADKIAKADYLTRVGLLSKSTAQVEKREWGKVNQLPYNVYQVTEQGKPFLTAPKGIYNGEFCTGKVVLESVSTFTEPADAFGMTISQVNYKVKLEEVADWATTEEAAQIFKGFSMKKAPIEDKAVLVLTNEGWKSEFMLK